MKLITLAVLLASIRLVAQVPVAQLPNEILIGDENVTITAVSLPTAILQYGAGKTWCPAQIYIKFPLILSYSTPNLAVCAFDPAPGAWKSMYAQQTATTYTVSIKSAAGVASAIIVPASTGTITPPPPVTTPPSSTATTITLAADGSCKQTGSIATGSLVLTFK